MCIDQANFTVKITNFGVSTSHENENAVLYHIMISTDSFLGRVEKGLGVLKVCPLLGYLPTHSLMLTLGFSYTTIDLGEHFTKHGCVVARYVEMKNKMTYLIHRYTICVCL